jgi:hypothetical protein
VIRLTLILLAAGRLLAQPAFYSTAYLEKWKPGFQTGIEENYHQVLLPLLTRAERQRLGEVRLEFPLFGKTRDAFELYSEPGATPARIVLPIASLRFFGDVCISTGWWREQQGRGPDPVMGYISRTKYGRAPRLSLRQAIGVPENAGENPRIQDFTTKCFSSGALFILLHEMGHVMERGRGAGGQQEEMAADAFALEIFRRLKTPPTGSVLFFSAAAYAAPTRWDFPNEKAYLEAIRESTHPVTSQRLKAISRELTGHAQDYRDPNPQRGPELARNAGQEILRLADFLEDYGVQRAMRLAYQ